MKYFFLSEGWIYGRCWEFGGLWDQATWKRKPEIKPLNYGIVQNGEALWLYQVEDAILMVEVKPQGGSDQPIGQVVLKRLITAEQAIQRLCAAECVLTISSDDKGLGLENRNKGVD